MKQVSLDWRTYFNEFCTIHGGSPVVYRGKFLFRDGFSYSQTDYAGPEYGAPTDPKELALVQREYWQRRREILVHEHTILKTQLREYEEAQRVRSAPLQWTMAYFDQETGKRVVKAAPVNFELIKEELQILADDIAHCDTQVQAIKD